MSVRSVMVSYVKLGKLVRAHAFFLPEISVELLWMIWKKFLHLAQNRRQQVFQIFGVKQAAQNSVSLFGLPVWAPNWQPPV